MRPILGSRVEGRNRRHTCEFSPATIRVIFDNNNNNENNVALLGVKPQHEAGSDGSEKFLLSPQRKNKRMNF